MKQLYSMPEPKVAKLSQTEKVDLFSYHVEAPPSWRETAEYLTEQGRLYGKKPITVVQDDAYGPEAYGIKIAQEAITIRTGGENGMRYAVYLLLQASYFGLPVGEIEDWPTLKLRGFHLNLSDYLRHTSVEGICSFIRACGRAKLNTVLIEYGTRFDHGEYQPEDPFVLSSEELKRILDTARAEGITVIPLIQTFGHLEFLLGQEKLKALREKEHEPQQLCPLNPEALRFSKEMIDSYVQAHPGIRYLHLGCDETTQLGKCPRCKEYVEKHGKGALYTQFVNPLIEHVCAKGLTPLVYDDMICAHPEAVEQLDRRAVLVYWDYWTINDPSPLLVARGGRRGSALVYDKNCWNDETLGRLSSLQRESLVHFCDPVDLEKELKPEYLQTFRPYLGEAFPKTVKAFPYMEFYKDRGFRVIAMPSCLGHGFEAFGAPDQSFFAGNIRTFARRAAESGSMGLITSAWFPYPEAVYPFGIALTGQYAWGETE